MNWVDVAIIALIGFSALLAFMRGLVHEVLGIGSWIAAGFIAAWAFPYVRDRFRDWIGEGDIGQVIGFGGVFLAALLILSLASGIISGMVRASVLGGVDRTLGIVFGLVRGAAVVVVAYIVAGMAVPIDAWPAAVQDARSLPYVYRGAVFAAELLPPDYRPVIHVPPGGRETKAADLMRVNPQGRAVARP